MSFNFPEGQKKDSESFKKWFRFGSHGTQLEQAGEPLQTIENICYGTYSKSDDVVERHKESNSN